MELKEAFCLLFCFWRIQTKSGFCPLRRCMGYEVCVDLLPMIVTNLLSKVRPGQGGGGGCVSRPDRPKQPTGETDPAIRAHTPGEPVYRL